MHEFETGTSRRFLAAQQFSRFRCTADIARVAASTTPSRMTPKRSWRNLSFDHLVSEREEYRRQLEFECLGGPEIDHKLKFGRLHHRQVPALAPLRMRPV